MNELLKIRDLTVSFYTYDGVVKALENVNLDIGRKETFGLVGETGCGKTLTALSILRLVPPPGQIESGNIYFSANGTGEPIDLLAISEGEIRKIRGSKISMVFQEPSAALNPVYTIGNQISEVLLLHRRQELVKEALKTVNLLLDKTDSFMSTLFRPTWLAERSLYQRITQNSRSSLPRVIGRIPLLRRLLWRLNSEANKMAVGLLKDVEIPDSERVAKQYPHQLSGGMKQRSVIAMALACSPKFLIADEPTTALDVTIQAQILELLRRLKDELESSVLYITHDLAVAAEICGRVGVMYSGSLCEVAKVDDLYANPLHPYTKALMAAVPKPGEEPHAIGGTVPDPINLPPGCRFQPRCDISIGICKEKVPPMLEVAPGHFVACHNYSGEADGTLG
jgi:peptide/nickel transport system ATP-binding protein